MTETDIETFGLKTGQELVSRARHAVEQSVRTDGDPALSLGPPTGDLGAVRGTFVTIKRGERLRGCIGRPNPDRPIGEVVVEAAIDAARNDPRCEPIRPGEVREVTNTVTVLSKPEPLSVEGPSVYPDHVEIGRHGLIVERGRHRGLLLPQVAVDRDWVAETFLTAACQKARLPGRAWRSGDVEIKRFTGRAFAEERPRGDVIERPLGQRVEDRNDDSIGCINESSEDDSEVVTDGGTIREPAVAGEFYAGTAERLREQLEESFTHEIGPGPLAEHENTDGETPLALVSPHAGYPYSGPVAAHSYADLAGGDSPESVVFLGPDHRRVGNPVAVAPHDRWRTPLGEVPLDQELAEAVVEASDDATFDSVAHEGEHSIEVQVPFLQHVLDEVSILPICLGGIGQERAEELGRTVAATADRVGRDIVVVSSTDLTHYQPHEAAVEADEPIRKAIERLDTDEIARQVEAAHSMCGPWATVAGLTVAREEGAEGGEIRQYATSADTAGSPSRVVGYCAAEIR